jgi:hypothetical protein
MFFLDSFRTQQSGMALCILSQWGVAHGEGYRKRSPILLYPHRGSSSPITPASLRHDRRAAYAVASSATGPSRSLLFSARSRFQ